MDSYIATKSIFFGFGLDPNPIQKLKNHGKAHHCHSGLKAGCSAFLMLVVMNKCFVLNPEKNWCRSVLSFLRIMQKSHNLILS